MAQVVLEVEARENAGKGFARRLRAAGKVPAVVYGKGMDATMVAVDPKALHKAVSGEAGWNTLLTLSGAGLDKKVVVLRDAQIHALRRDMLSVDFHAINLKEKGHFMVPVNLVGISKGQKMGGSTQLIRKELEVACLPTEVPQSIDIDIEALDIGDTVHIQDVTVPAGVELVHDVNFTVVTVIGHSAEEESDEEAEVAESDED
ncbi:50S ribosomal protein L25 [Pelovirga terrestris]|uniref:Large ribosomal subunit protein bL25 n=1 Tax=Pelovirga terrestris TaxID=2771352 RepID=A0A8J6QMJ1_9BACT|nr:50S ribosomal protein L25 [Pelovirga terrestris]MBD1400117.1 50S ribosomal protein L25 [Pelovirga terrestris]